MKTPSHIIWLAGRLLGKRFRLWYHDRTGRWLWGIFHLLREVAPLQDVPTRGQAELNREIDNLIKELHE